MTIQRRSALAWIWLTVVVALSLELATLALLNHDVYPAGDVNASLLMAVAATVWATIGAIIVVRTGNLVGWILIAVATAMAGSPASEQYIVYAIITAPSSLPLVPVAARIGPLTMTFLWGIGLLFLVFPTGRPLTPRWRPAVWLLLTGAVVHGVGWLFRLDDTGERMIPGPWTERGVSIANPLATPSLDWVWQVGVAIALIGSSLGVVSLVLRYRRAAGEERAQLRWLSFVGIVIVIAFLVGALVPGLRDGNITFPVMFLCVILGIPASCAIAILRYHLYDLDVVIRKTVVFGLLAAFITAVYASIVSVASVRFEGSQAGSFIAAATLAVLFAPARDRARRIADRLVYGRRATPYEVLAEFSERVGEAYAAEDVLERMARVLMEGTGAVGARVLLRVGTERREAATVGERGAEETVVEVTHQGEDLGALAVSVPASEPMNPAKRKLMEDLAAQAGLVLRNVRLIEELKASRQRLVAAQDDERRKIERNIHDGAQQQLVALAVQLRLAEGLVGTDPERERELLAQLQGQAAGTLEDLRDLARGIYPPLLADEGLGAALRAQAAKAAVPTSVGTDGIGRFPQEVESAVYFCVLEALNNVAKYARAEHVEIALARQDGDLTFSVTDDGDGFDPASTTRGTGLQGMADRLEAIGGSLEVSSAPGEGTTIAGAIPTG